MKKVSKIAAFVFSGIILVIVIVCFLIAKGFLNGFIVSQIVVQANNALDAEVSVGELVGNPFERLTIRDVKMVQNEREILHIDEMDLGYSLFHLLKNEIAIDHIRINDLKVNVWQDRDSLWNVQKLVKVADQPAPDDSASSFSFIVNLKEIECLHLSAIIQPLDSASIIPKSLEAKLSASFILKGDEMKLNMKEFALKTVQPNVEVESLILEFSSNAESYNWDRLKLKMPHSVILSEGKYYPRQPLRSSGQITVDTIAFDDFRKFLPQFSLNGNPSVTIIAKGAADRINLSVLVQEQMQKCEINGWVKSLETTPEYDLVMNVQNIDGSTWMGNPEYTTKITGSLHAKGIGYDPQKAVLTASGNFTELTYQDKTLKNLIFQAEKDSTLIRGNLATDAWFGGLAADFSVADYLSKFRYSVVCSGKNIDLSKIYFPKNLNSSINLKIKAEGVGINPLKGSVKANIISSGSTITNRAIDEFQTSFSYVNGNYDLVDFNLNTPFFHLVAEGKGDIQNENDIRFSFETKELNDLLKLTGFGQYSLDGKIDGNLSGNMRSYKILANVDVASFNSDSLFVKGFKGDLNLAKDTNFLADSRLNVREVRMGTQVFQNLHANLNAILAEEISLGFKLDADTISINQKNIGAFKGEARLYSDDSLRFDTQIKLDSLSYLPYQAGATDLNFNAQLSEGGLIPALHQLTDEFNYQPFLNYLEEAKKDSAKIAGHLGLQNFLFDSLSIEKLEADLDLIADLNNVRGTLSATVDSIGYNDFKVRNSKLQTSFVNKKIWNEWSIDMNDSISANTKFEVDLNQNIEIGLKQFELRTPFNFWKGGGDSTKMIYGNNSLEFKKLLISANELNFIKAEGILAFKGNENLDVSLRGFDLGNINNFVGGSIPISGNLDASLNLSGTSAKPLIKGIVEMSNVQVKDEKIDRIQANLNYTGDMVNIDGNVVVADTLIFETTLKSPFHFSLEDSTFNMPSSSDYVNAEFKLNRLNLSMLKPFLPPDLIDIKGHVNSDIKASGQLNNLSVEGFADWKDGKFHIPEYGILYDNIRLNAGIKNDSIFINEFKAEAGAGSLELSGYSRLDQQNSYAPKVISMRLIGKEFKVIDSDRLQATINTNITLKNNGDNPVFAGDLEVIRSEVNADAFIADYSKASDEADLPMLVKALNDQSKKSIQSLQSDSISDKLNANLELYNKLRGSFNITIPRNLWIRGKDMGIEVKGNLRAVKEGLNPVLFGELEVKQGFYRFYGKRFDFRTGKITLTGDENINPILEFVVVYSFRDYEKNLKSLEMIITGRMEDPQIAFAMNGSKLEEQDALSYIVFGCSMAELSDGQESTLDISTSTIAKNVAFGQMSSVLQDAVQSSLKLDVVEIAGEDNWDAASVTVGKYISNNLYMSYQYTFALDKKTKIMEPQKISVEYQFYKFLSLKATNQSPNSGLDFIYKKEYK